VTQHVNQPSNQPLHVIRPAGSRWFPDLAELWQFRDLCVALGRRDVTLRYRQTILGIVWVLLQPLIAGGVFAVIFGKVAGLKTGTSTSYFLFAYAGFVGWSAFQNALSRAAGSVLGQGHLVTKVFFPRLVLPISAVFSALIDFGVAMAALLVWFGITRMPIGPALLTLPFWAFLLFAMGLGLGTIAAALSVRFRDVQHALPVLVQLLLYASPVAYATSVVPESVRRWFVLNPLAGALDGFRWAVLGADPPSGLSVAIAVAGTVVTLVAGAVIFARFERQLADVI
jgi:lipopolysaccharide transport system permease protein